MGTGDKGVVRGSIPLIPDMAKTKGPSTQTIKRAQSDRKIPPWGRKEGKVKRSIGMPPSVSGGSVSANFDSTLGPVALGGPGRYSSDVPIGTNQPTMVQGTLIGGMPNWNRMSRGRLQTQKGKYRNTNQVF